MRSITEINNDARQKFVLVTENGEEINFLLEFKPTQEGWFFNLEYSDTTINGVRLCNFPNILRQWKNSLPFGMACTVTDGGEPNFVDDFVTGRVQVHLLTESEVEQIEEDSFGG